MIGKNASIIARHKEYYDVDQFENGTDLREITKILIHEHSEHNDKNRNIKKEQRIYCLENFC